MTVRVIVNDSGRVKSLLGRLNLLRVLVLIVFVLEGSLQLVDVGGPLPGKGRDLNRSLEFHVIVDEVPFIKLLGCQLLSIVLI